jgi:glycoprotein endo-alpha-1,2-mannosidase
MTISRRQTPSRHADILCCIFAFATAAQAVAQGRATVNVARVSDLPFDAPIIGAYYYPWYGVKSRPVADDWRNVFRRRLVPRQMPSAGLYRSADPVVIKEHLAQSRRGGISLWAVSWWGPESATDRVFLGEILSHPDAGDFRFAVLYESTGRFGDHDDPTYDNWLNDLAYLAEKYFGHPNYLRINGRPALFVYLTRVYFRDQGAEALSKARGQFKDVYLIGDDVFGEGYRTEWAKQFDAVTIYDVYGQSAAIDGATQKAVKRLAANYAAAREAANLAAAAFIPTVTPGYNDTAVRSGHSGAPRYFVDEPDSQEGDLFRHMIREAAIPNLDDRAGRMLMVTSFNEWYEDTQIEATTGQATATTIDDSKSGSKLTSGDRYEDYRTLYLDILRDVAIGIERAP